MKVTIDIQYCEECPYSWPGDTKSPHESVVCDQLQDNVGKGDTVSDRCLLEKQRPMPVDPPRPVGGIKEWG